MKGVTLHYVNHGAEQAVILLWIIIPWCKMEGWITLSYDPERHNVKQLTVQGDISFFLVVEVKALVQKLWGEVQWQPSLFITFEEEKLSHMDVSMPTSEFYKPN